MSTEVARRSTSAVPVSDGGIRRGGCIPPTRSHGDEAQGAAFVRPSAEVAEFDVPHTGTSRFSSSTAVSCSPSPRPSALAITRVPSIVLHRVGGAPMPRSGESASLKKTIPSAKIPQSLARYS
jgi:hypothetical protein